MARTHRGIKIEATRTAIEDSYEKGRADALKDVLEIIANQILVFAPYLNETEKDDKERLTFRAMVIREEFHILKELNKKITSLSNKNGAKT